MEPVFKIKLDMSEERYKDCYFQFWTEKEITNIVLGIALAFVGIIFLLFQQYLFFIAGVICSATLIYQTVTKKKRTFNNTNDKRLNKFGRNEFSNEMEFYDDRVVMRDLIYGGAGELYYAGFNTLFVRSDFAIIATYCGGIYILRENTEDFDDLVQFLKEKCVKAKIREKKRKV